MNFDQKLNTLMHLFKISNSKLARGIGVDASLVSRWKSGERKISPNSPHIPMLSSFFLKLNAYHYQIEYLNKIINAHLPPGQEPDEASRIHILADWLVSPEPPEPQPDEQPEQLAQSVSVINNISEILSGEKPSNARTPQPISVSGGEETIDSGWQPVVLPGKRQTYEVFEGRTGRRQVILNAFYQILQSEQKLEIYLTSEDDTRWLTEDPSYTALWAKLMQQMIDKGHKVTIIHVLSRKVNEIMGMLSYWIPLHMTGKIDSYFYPRFGNRQIRQTYMVIRDKMAIYSSTIADFSGNDLTYKFDDPVTVNQMMRLFNVHLKGCRPLFSVFNQKNADEFYAFESQLNKKGGRTSNIRHHLNIRMLPETILDHHLLPEDRSIKEAITAQQAAFIQRLDSEAYVDILPLSLIRSIQETGRAQIACCDIFTAEPVKLDEDETVLWLKTILDTLQDHDNYQLFFVPDNSDLNRIAVNITLREGSTAMFSPFEAHNMQTSIISLNEQNIIRSMSYLVDDIVQNIPPNLKDRREVSARIERLIATISGRPADQIN